MSAKIVITAPHATCPKEGPGKEHQCDISAGLAAKEAALILGTTALIGDTPRTKVDLNRAESRGSGYRKRVSEKLGSADAVFDIHSFPATSLEWYTDVVILNFPATDRNLLYALQNNIKNQGYTVSIVEGFNRDDIVMESQAKGKNAFLIELNEKLNAKTIGQDIGRAIKEIYEE